MSSPLSRLLVYTAVLLCPSAAAETAPWTVQNYVSAVLQISPDYLGSQQRLASAMAQWKGQFAAQWLPTLSMSNLTYPYGNDPSEGYSFKHWRMDNTDMALTTTLDWNLFNSFSDQFKTRQAALAKETSAETVETTRQSVALSAMQAFYDLGLQNRLHEVAKENLESLAAQYHTTNALYEQGSKNLADLLKSETDWRSSEERMAAAQGQSRSALLQFNLLLDLPLDTTQTLDLGSDLETTELPIVGEGEQEAMAHRPEIQSARLAIESTRTSGSQARQQALPQATLDFLYNRLDDGRLTGAFAGVNSPYSGLVTPNYQLAFKLALPFGFNGVSQYQAVSAADAVANAAVRDFDVVRRQVVMQVHAAYITLEQAIATYAIAARKEDIARRTVQLVNQQYRNGSADVIRLSEAQLDYLDARVERAQALHDARSARAQYQLATGRPLWQ